MASTQAVSTPIGATRASCGPHHSSPDSTSLTPKIQETTRCAASSYARTARYSSSTFRTSLRHPPARRRPLIVQATSAAVPASPDSASQDLLESQEGLHLPFSTRWAPIPPPLPPPPKDTSLINVLPFLWSLAAADVLLRWRLGLALLLLVAGKVSGLAGPLLFKRALDNLTPSGPTSFPLPPSVLYPAVAALVVSAISKAFSAVANELRNIVFTPVGQATGRRVEYWFFAHVLSMDMAYHLDRKTGALARIIERGKRSITMIFRAVVFTFIPTAVELLLVCGLLAKHVAPAFAWAVLLTFATYIAWTVALTRASVAKRKEVNQLDQQTTGKVVDILINYETVVQFNNQALDLHSYDSLLLDYQKAAVHLEYVSAALNGGQSVIIAVGLGAVMAMAGLRVGAGSMTIGDLVLVNGLVLQLSLPLQFLGFLYRDLRQSLVDIEAMFETLGTEPKLKSGTLLLPPSSKGLTVEVKDVHFGYALKEHRTRKVLHGVSFSVASGDSVAIVGPSGSGKSTLVKLLLRIFDPEEGSLLLDGCDVKDLTLDALRDAVAVVPQDTVLFNETILYNIAYGRPSATRQEIEDAAKQAKLYDAIRRMPEGFNTMVGERGLKLSGGEKQRVAIARAFLKLPRLLICDEATSALDSRTEVAILRSLKELASGRTCLFVAHRLSTIKHCTTILVMDGGEIIERGNHEELVARGSHYAKMWKLQEAQTPSRDAMGDEGVEYETSTSQKLGGEGSREFDGAHMDGGAITDDDILTKDSYEQEDGELDRITSKVEKVLGGSGEGGNGKHSEGNGIVK